MYEKRLKLRFARGWSPTQIAKNKNWRGVRFRFFEKSKKAKNWSIGLSGYKGTSAADQSGSPSYCFDQGLYPTGGFSPGTDHGLRLQSYFRFLLNRLFNKQSRAGICANNHGKTSTTIRASDSTSPACQNTHTVI